MELSIEPAPSDAEREAIETAFAAAHGEPEPTAPRGAWWRLGLEEALSQAAMR